jgi:hypothetical protein
VLLPDKRRILLCFFHGTCSIYDPSLPCPDRWMPIVYTLSTASVNKFTHIPPISSRTLTLPPGISAGSLRPPLLVLTYLAYLVNPREKKISNCSKALFPSRQPVCQRNPPRPLGDDDHPPEI